MAKHSRNMFENTLQNNKIVQCYYCAIKCNEYKLISRKRVYKQADLQLLMLLMKEARTKHSISRQFILLSFNNKR
jgi:hypothetical protein